MNQQLSGSSYYDEDDNCSVRSDPPMILENYPAAQAQTQNNKQAAQDYNPGPKIPLLKKPLSNSKLLKPRQSPPKLSNNSSKNQLRNSSNFKLDTDDGDDYALPKSSNGEISSINSQKNQRSSAANPPLKELLPESTGSNKGSLAKIQFSEEEEKKEKVNSKKSSKGNTNKKLAPDGNGKGTKKVSTKVSDIMKGNFTPIEIPIIDIPGSSPLIYMTVDDLLAEIDGKDEFLVDDIEEEFMMFTAEMQDRRIRKQDGPHQTLRWRKKVRDYKAAEAEQPPLTEEVVEEPQKEEKIDATTDNILQEEIEVKEKQKEEEIVKTVDEQVEEPQQLQQPVLEQKASEAELIQETVGAEVERGIEEHTRSQLQLMLDEDIKSPDEAKEEEIKDISQQSEKFIDMQTIAIKPVYEITNTPSMTQEAQEQRFVQFDNIRAVRESMDQLYVKEYETTWIDQQLKYDDLMNIPRREAAEVADEVEIPQDEVVVEKNNSQESIGEYSFIEDGSVIAADAKNDSIDSKIEDKKSQSNFEEEVLSDNQSLKIADDDKMSIEVAEEQISQQQKSIEIIDDAEEEIVESAMDDEQQNFKALASSNYDMDIELDNNSSQPQLEGLKKQVDGAGISSYTSLPQDKDINESESQIQQEFGQLPSDSNGVKAGTGDIYSSSEKIEEEKLDKKQEESKQTHYNPASNDFLNDSVDHNQSQVSIAKAKKRKISHKKRTKTSRLTLNKASSQEEMEFSRLREGHEKAEARNNSTMTLRTKKKKLTKKNTKSGSIGSIHLKSQGSIDLDSSVKSKPKNPPVPRFAHPPIVAKSTSLPLVALPIKKPRPPPVPEHLRASQQSPTPMKQMRESQESQLSLASKKPPVPRVTELMPGAVILKPERSTSPQRTTPLKKFVNSPTKKPAQTKFLPQTPSVSNIHKPPVAQKLPKTISHKQTTPPKKILKNSISPTNLTDSIQKGSMSIIGVHGGKLATFKKKKKSLASRTTVKPILSPEEIEEKYGNFRVIRPTREQALSRIISQQDHMVMPITTEKSPTQRFTIDPQNDGQESISMSLFQRQTQQVSPTAAVALLSHNSSQAQPYEQQLVAQLFDVYRKKKNRPPVRNLYDRHDSLVRDRKVQMPQISTIKDQQHDGEFEDDASVQRKPFDTDALSTLAGKNKQRPEIPPNTVLSMISTAREPMSIQVSAAVDGGISNITGIPSRTEIMSKHQSQTLSNAGGPANNIKGAKMYSPFSPATYSKLVGLQNKARRFAEQITATTKKSRAINKQMNSTSRDRMSGSPQGSQLGEGANSNNDVVARALDYSKSNLVSRNTFHVENRNESDAQLLQVNPSWREIGQRKSTIDAAGAGADRRSIYDLLKKNSQSFLQKEKNHIDTFRKAQSIQKKNLQLEKVGGGAATQRNSLGPVNKASFGYLTQRHHSKQLPTTTNRHNNNNNDLLEINHQQLQLTKKKRQLLNEQSNNNLPVVNGHFFNAAHPVMEEYGGDGSSSATGDNYSYQHQPANNMLGKNHQIPVLGGTTNQSDFKAALSKKNSNHKNHSLYPTIFGVGAGDQNMDYASIQAGIPQNMHNSGRTRAREAPSNESNFFPSFDSRGNVGIVDDSNEFGPKKPQRQQKLKAGFFGETRMSVDQSDRNQHSSNQRSSAEKSQSSQLPSLNPNRRSSSISNNIAKVSNNNNNNSILQ